MLQAQFVQEVLAIVAVVVQEALLLAREVVVLAEVLLAQEEVHSVHIALHLAEEGVVLEGGGKQVIRFTLLVIRFLTYNVKLITYNIVFHN